MEIPIGNALYRRITSQPRPPPPTIIHTFTYILTNLYSAKNRENGSEALAQDD